MEDNSLNELAAQYRQLESSGHSGSNNLIHPEKKYGYLFKNYGIYLLFFIWVLIFVIALQPSFLYQKIDDNDKYKFLWKRFFITIIISYLTLILVYIGFKYYANKE